MMSTDPQDEVLFEHTTSWGWAMRFGIPAVMAAPVLAATLARGGAVEGGLPGFVYTILGICVANSLALSLQNPIALRVTSQFVEYSDWRARLQQVPMSQVIGTRRRLGLQPVLRLADGREVPLVKHVPMGRIAAFESAVASARGALPP